MFPNANREFSRILFFFFLMNDTGKTLYHHVDFFYFLRMTLV